MILKIKYFILFTSVLSVAASNKMYTNIQNLIVNKTDYSVKCIKNIASKHFPCGTLMTLVNSNMDVEDFIKVLSNGSCNSLVIRSFKETDWLIWTDVYIITSRDKFEFLTGILRLRRDVMWNPRAKFIIQIQNLKFDDISEIFNMSNYYKMYNVVLLGNKYDINIIYTYYPFSNGACSNNFQNPVTVGHCEDIKNISKIFQNDIPDIIDNCTFRVIAAEDIPNFIFETSNFTVFGEHVLGMEQYLLSIIAKHERVQFQFLLKSPNYTYGFVLQDYTATGLLHYLQNDSADIAAGGFILMKNRIEMFDYIWGLNYASFKIITPTNADIIWDDVYKEFNIDTWALILIIYCLILIIFVVKYYTMSKTHQNITYLALRLWGYLCGNPSSKLPKVENMRIILVWWIWFTFFIVNFYNTTMFSLITRRFHIKSQPNPDKLEDIPYYPCISNKTRTFLLFAYNKTLPMGKDYQFCKDSETTLDFIASRKDLYTVDKEYTYALNEYKYIDAEGFPKLDLVQFYNQHTIAFYFSRGFPYRAKIDKYAKQLFENGLSQRQLQKILQHGQIVRHRRKKSFKIINIVDLTIHYYCLLGGYALSIVLFLIEMMLHRKMISNN